MENEEDAIKTLAFMDLEATGLPDLEFFKTKITELSVIACSVKQINETPMTHPLPRVLHKLSLCFKPMLRISEKAEDITGLDNYKLEHENTFNGNVGQLFCNFLLHLQQPVCLVAHNGDYFDFPLLRKELVKLGTELPESLKCVDSLNIFRKIDEIVELDETDDVLALPLDEAIISTDHQQLNEPSLESKTNEILTNEYIKEDIISRQQKNETTPSHGISATILGAPHRPGVGSKKPTFQHSDRPPKRKLFDGPSAKPWTQNKKKFTLVDVFQRLHDHKPTQSHYAEADAETLLRCVVRMRKDFLKIANKNCKPFADVKELGKT